MCRFKDILEDIAKRITKFQYILCVGSRNDKLAKAFMEKNFNTSYVSVQAGSLLVKRLEMCNFNTSYVSVQATIASEQQNYEINFNTSYVSVQV